MYQIYRLSVYIFIKVTLDCDGSSCDTCISTDGCEWCGYSEKCYSSSNDSCLNNAIATSCPALLYLVPDIILEGKEEQVRVNVEGLVDTTYSCHINGISIEASECIYIFLYLF